MATGTNYFINLNNYFVDIYNFFELYTSGEYADETFIYTKDTSNNFVDLNKLFQIKQSTSITGFSTNIFTNSVDLINIFENKLSNNCLNYYNSYNGELGGVTNNQVGFINIPVSNNYIFNFSYDPSDFNSNPLPNSDPSTLIPVESTIAFVGYFIPEFSGQYTISIGSDIDDECYIWLNSSLIYPYQTTSNNENAYRFVDIGSSLPNNFTVNLQESIEYPIVISYSNYNATQALNVTFQFNSSLCYNYFYPYSNEWIFTPTGSFSGNSQDSLYTTYTFTKN